MGGSMGISLSIGPVVAIIAGILILIIPRLLNYIIALYLIVTGVLGLMGPRAGINAFAPETPSAAVHSTVPAPVGNPIGI
jgi:hypothetical protein